MRLVLLLYLLFSSVAQAGPIVTRAEPGVIKMGLGFDGATVTVIGAIKGDALLDGAGDPEIVIVLAGRPHSPVLVKMEPSWGIWAASPQRRINYLPSYYAVATSRRGTLEMLKKFGQSARIRLEDKLAYANRIPILDWQMAALTSVMRSNGVYAEYPGEVSVVNGTLFKAQFNLPAGIPPGAIRIESFLISGGKAVASDNTALVAIKAALPRKILNFLLEYAVLYAVVLIAGAILITWAVSAFLSRLSS